MIQRLMSLNHLIQASSVKTLDFTVEYAFQLEAYI